MFYSSKNTENKQLTNIYIYRQELITRSEVSKARKDLNYEQTLEDILTVPNLEDLLATL